MLAPYTLMLQQPGTKHEVLKAEGFTTWGGHAEFALHCIAKAWTVS
jgi:hypothetical protein